MDGFVNVTAFTILACLWLAFAVALVASRSSLEATWRGVFIDYVAFERPASWRSVGRSRGLLVASEGRVDRTPDGARLTLHVELAPQGRLRLIAPLLGRFMRGRERRNVAAIRERLERGAQTNGGGQQ